MTPATGPQTQPQFAIISSDVTERLWRISDSGDLIFTANDSVSSYSASGQLKWRKSIGGTVFDVAIGSDGTVFASSANSVIALNKDTGSTVWPNPVAANNGNESSPMAIGPDGTIYFLSGAGLVGFDPPNVTAINPSGTIRFKTTADFGWGRGNTGLTMNNDASIMYIWGFPTSLISLSGTTGNQIASSNGCRFHGVFQFTPFNTGYSFDGDSQLIEFGQSLLTCSPVPIGSSLLGVVAVAPSNNIILQLFTGSLTKEPLAAVDRQGRRIWTSTERYSSGIIIGNSSPFMDGNGSIFCIAPETNDVVAIDSDSGSVMWRSHFNDPISRLLLGGNGTLYVVAGDKLYGNLSTTSSPQRPLIFIPGIAGSRLESPDVVDNPLWPSLNIPASSRLTLDPQEQQVRVRATDVIRRSSIVPVGDVYATLLENLVNEVGYVEYESFDVAGTGCDPQNHGKNNNPTLFVFPYDWRKSNSSEDNITRLESYITCVRQIHPNTQIDILTHSMGGLLARRYMLDHPNDVRKFITIAAPWLGAPKAINVLETGEFVDSKFGRLLTKGAFKKLSEFFPGVHELLPSESYFALNGRPLAVNGQAINDYSLFVNTMDARFPRGKPATAGREFHARLGQDNGRIEPIPVQSFHFYGVKPNLDTIGKVIITVQCVRQGSRCVNIEKFDYVYTKGDGTVPRLSARRGYESPLQPGLNAIGATVREFSDANAELAGHNGLTRNPLVLSAVIGALRSAPPAMSQATAEINSEVTGDDETPAEPAYYFKIIGTASLTATNSSGQSTNPFSDPQDGGVPGVSSYVTSEKSVDVIVPLDQVYTVTFTTNTDPLAISITRETEQADQAVRYQDLTLPAGVKAVVKLTPQGIEQLRYDSDGDGTFETTVTPTVSVSGTSAQDTDPPLITIAETRQSQNVTVVTVTATDSGSGVKKINYSLDGTNYQTYSAPFSVDPYRVRRIYGFADDNVANRSGLVEFQLTAPPPIVFVEQGTTNRAVALDSVTWMRAPFPILTNFNFTADRHTRVILFISGLLLTQSDASIVTVQASGMTLPVENVGTVAGVTGLNASYIVVRLPDGLPVGELPLTIAVGGIVNTNSVTLGISP